MLDEYDESEQIKEVYARFGLAVYEAQVLEHGLVNALLVIDLIPSRRHLARSREEWAAEVDSFTDLHFETTMGRMMRALRHVANVPSDVEGLLRDALRRRNWLAHHFFRECATEFMSVSGREQMLRDVDECRDCFAAADKRLEELIRPIRIKAGITDELLEQEYSLLRSGARHDG